MGYLSRPTGVEIQGKVKVSTKLVENDVSFEGEVAVTWGTDKTVDKIGIKMGSKMSVSLGNPKSPLRFGMKGFVGELIIGPGMEILKFQLLTSFCISKKNGDDDCNVLRLDLLFQEGQMYGSLFKGQMDADTANVKKLLPLPKLDALPNELEAYIPTVPGIPSFLNDSASLPTMPPVQLASGFTGMGFGFCTGSGGSRVGCGFATSYVSLNFAGFKSILSRLLKLGGDGLSGGMLMNLNVDAVISNADVDERFTTTFPKAIRKRLQTGFSFAGMLQKSTDCGTDAICNFGNKFIGKRGL